MKPFRGSLLAAALTALSSHAFADLAVVQVGAGASALNNSSTAAFVKLFPDAGGSPTATIALPTAASGANQPFTLSGSATSEGFLNVSTNGQYLTLGGYAVAPGVGNVAAATAALVPRAVARIALVDNAVDTSTVFTADTSYSTGNIRSVASTNGTDLWAAGDGSSTTGGVRYTTLGSTTSTIVSSATPAPTLSNARAVNIFNGQLYASSSSAPTSPSPGANYRGVIAIGTGLPTAGPQTITPLLPAADSGDRSSYDFWFKDASTLYIADDGLAANGGGIQKWIESAGTWSLAYTLLNSGATTTGVRGLSGTVVGGDAVLYATTTQTSANRLITVTDTGAAATETTLATAPMLTAFRGVEFIGGSIEPPTGDADFDGDGDVDGADFLTWQRGLGAGGPTQGDADGNGTVDAVDLDAWKAQYGPAVAAAGGVPEPTSAALIALGAVAYLATVRRGGGFNRLIR